MKTIAKDLVANDRFTIPEQEGECVVIQNPAKLGLVPGYNFVKYMVVNGTSNLDHFLPMDATVEKIEKKNNRKRIFAKDLKIGQKFYQIGGDWIHYKDVAFVCERIDGLYVDYNHSKIPSQKYTMPLNRVVEVVDTISVNPIYIYCGQWKTYTNEYSVDIQCAGDDGKFAYAIKIKDGNKCFNSDYIFDTYKECVEESEKVLNENIN